MKNFVFILLIMSNIAVNAQKIDKNLLFDNWKIVSTNGKNVSKNMKFVFQINDSTLVFADNEHKYSLEEDNIFYEDRGTHEVWHIVKLNKDKLIIKDFVNKIRFKCIRTEEDVIDQ
jgi:exopolysaccharide biosynthesis protein